MQLVGRLFQEVMAGHPLADQPSLHVGKTDQNGVDVAARHQPGQTFQIEISGHVAPRFAARCPDPTAIGV